MKTTLIFQIERSVCKRKQTTNCKIIIVLLESNRVRIERSVSVLVVQ